MKKFKSLFLWMMGCLFCLNVIVPSNVWATATGLNNIPTADIPPTKTVIIQQFSTMGSNQRPTHSVGFKTGLLPWLEFGMDRLVGPSPSGKNVFQSKVRLECDKFPKTAIGVGVANVAFTSRSRGIVGQPFPYVVVSHDLGWGRAHLGADVQRNNEGAFYGFDKELFKSKLPGFLFRADGIMVNNGKDLLHSVGFIYHPQWEAPFDIALESWYSFSSQPGSENDYLMIKWNYIIKF